MVWTRQPSLAPQTGKALLVRNRDGVVLDDRVWPGGLTALAEEKILRKLFLVSEDPIETKRGSIRCLPWRTFLDELWSDKLL